jgi:hypothetical protein
MKMASGNRAKTIVLVGVALLAAAAAVYLLLPERRPAAPDADTSAAIERSRQMEAEMARNQPTTPDLPVEKRAPRGAVPTQR